MSALIVQYVHSLYAHNLTIGAVIVSEPGWGQHI
jgi:hypothetical protein